jgi:hypothetical protein
MLEAMIAKLGLNLLFGRVAGVVKRIPPKAWLYIAIAVAVVAGFLWHQHAAHSALKKADAAGYVRAMGDVEKRALKLKAKMDAVTAKISNQERKRNEEAHRRIDRSADALLVRGPGKAVCSVRSQPSASPNPAPGAGQVAGGLDQMPNGGGSDLIALPFTGTVKFARQADHCEADLASVWSWYGDLVKAWPKAGDKSP